VPLTVLFVTRFAGDEPVSEGIAAAGLVAGVEFIVTGRLEDLPDELREAAPANVRFVGFLPFEEYRRHVEHADVVMALTTEPTSAMRSAYEAVYAGKPLVVSDFALDRELFPFAVHTANDSAAIAAAVSSAAERIDELHGHAAEARRLQVERFDAQLAALATALGSGGGA
jgi:glycosyltransferase involved in cell wall biosynthesis